MGKIASALAALGAALLVAHLGQFTNTEASLDPAATGPAVTWSAVLAKATARPSSSLLNGLVGRRLTQRAAASTRSGPASAAAGTSASHHDPLVTYHLSATSLRLRPASPLQHPGTHVVQLPLAGLSPLTAATYMPSDLEQLSSRGAETYMVRTLEFIKNQAAVNRLLEEWEGAGWVDPVTGAVTQPDTLPVCGPTLARRRGYVAAALAAQAAAAHRSPINITTLAATLGVASLRTRCPQSLLLTRTGSAAAAVADVLDVTLLQDAAGNESVELLLRVVEDPHIVAEHDPGHPVQELEGRGNHYHFVLPRDMAIDAGRLLEEVGPVGGHSAGGELLEGAWGLVLKGLADSPLGSSLQVVGGQFRITGSECVTSCGQTGYPITVSSTAPTAGSCTVRYAVDPGLVCFNTPLSPGRVGCAWAATCTWNQPATVTLRAPGAGGVPVVLATAYVLAATPAGCDVRDPVLVGDTASGSGAYCGPLGGDCPSTVTTSDYSVTLTQASGTTPCRVSPGGDGCALSLLIICAGEVDSEGNFIQRPCCPVTYTCPLNQAGSVTVTTPKGPSKICVLEPPPTSVCRAGYSSANLPAGPYKDTCTGCCLRTNKPELYCDTCACPAGRRRGQKSSKPPKGTFPKKGCPSGGVVYDCNSQKLKCAARGKDEGEGDDKGDDKGKGARAADVAAIGGR